MTTGSVTPEAPQPEALLGPTCKTCVFRVEGALRCRRFPPVAAVGAPALWPSTRDEDWCGEYELRPASQPLRSFAPSPCAGCGALPLAACADGCQEALARRQRIQVMAANPQFEVLGRIGEDGSLIVRRRDDQAPAKAPARSKRRR